MAAPAQGEDAGSALQPVFAIVLAVAAGLRFWNLGSSGISSAAAGVCAAAAVDPDPSVPPLVPWIFRSLFAFWAPSEALAITAIALFGVATVLAVFLAGRRLAGDGAALVAAAALSGMELHLVFSRQARPEVALAFLALSAVWAGLGAIERKSLGLAGVAVLAAAAALLAVLPPDLHPLSLEGLSGAARLVGRSLSTWTSPFVLASAALGLGVCLARRARKDLLLLAWVALCLLPLPFLRPDPGNLVPLLPPLALAAGIGLDALARKLAPPKLALIGARELAPIGARWRSAVLAVAVLVAGAWPALPVLHLEDRGYELAVRYLDQGKRDPRPDILVLEPAIRFYLAQSGGSHALVEEFDPRAIPALEEGAFRYLVGDVRLLGSPAFKAFLAEHGSELKQVASIGNPLAEPTIAAAAGFEFLDALRASTVPAEDRAALTTIRVWRSVRTGTR